VFQILLLPLIMEEGNWAHAVRGCCRSDPHQGRVEASLCGSSSTVALRSPPSTMVEGRPLPPPSAASIHSGRRLMAMFNLQAAMPTRRPLCSSTAGSRHPAPSGLVDYVVSRSFAGEGAGPDGVSFSSFRVFSAKSVDLIVLFYFLLVLVVIWCSTDDLE
jgi:hypothetical protein